MAHFLAEQTAESAAALRSMDVDPDAIGAAGLGYERLDQIMCEYLIGAR